MYIKLTPVQSLKAFEVAFAQRWNFTFVILLLSQSVSVGISHALALRRMG